MKVKLIICFVVLLSMSISACGTKKVASSFLVTTDTVSTADSVTPNASALISTPTPTANKPLSPTVYSDIITPKTNEATSTTIIEPFITPDCTYYFTEVPINDYDTRFVTNDLTSPQVTQFNSVNTYANYDVYINDKKSTSLSGDYYLLSDDNNQCILFPLLKVAIEFGASIVSTDDNTIIFQYENNKFVLNLSDSTLIKYEDGTNCIIPAPDSYISIRKTDNDLYLDSVTLRTSLYIIGIRLIIHDSISLKAIYIWTDS